VTSVDTAEGSEEAAAAPPATSVSPEAEAEARRSGHIVRAHIYVATIFLFLGLGAVLFTSYELVEPSVGSGSPWFSYGRLLPAGTNLLIFGWLAIGLLGVSYYTVARVTGGRIWGGPLPLANLALASAGTLAGVIAVLAGENQGRLYLELPWWSNLAIVLSLFLGAFILTGTASGRSYESGSPVVWYALAGSWMAALALASGAVPGPEGMNAVLQQWFFAASFLFGALLCFGVGLAYYVVVQITGETFVSSRLTAVGFWSMVFIAGWLGPRFGIHGPAPSWLQTVGVVFSVLFFIPVWTVLADLVIATRGHWPDLRSRGSVLFAGAGAVGFALLPIVNVTQGLRNSSAVVRFTAWDPALFYLILFGIVGMWWFAVVYRSVPVLFPGLVEGSDMPPIHWWFAVPGLLVGLGAMWVAGLMQGYTWVGGVNSDAYSNYAEGYINSVAPLEAWYLVRLLGFGFFAVGVVLFGVSIVVAAASKPEFPGDDAEVARQALESAATVAARVEAAPEEEVADLTRGPARIGSLIQAVVALFVLAAVAVFVVPSFEEDHTEESLRALERDFPEGSVEARGREIYQAEGCWYCHTQEVRATIPDVGLGPVTLAGDLALLGPPPVGTERIGPDLAHAGSREPTNDPAWVVAHLRAPRAPALGREWSIAPSYDYLSSSDLQAVAAYITALD
jgi:cbb3-type cytochrome oxidase subunit 1